MNQYDEAFGIFWWAIWIVFSFSKSDHLQELHRRFLFVHKLFLPIPHHLQVATIADALQVGFPELSWQINPFSECSSPIPPLRIWYSQRRPLFSNAGLLSLNSNSYHYCAGSFPISGPLLTSPSGRLGTMESRFDLLKIFIHTKMILTIQVAYYTYVLQLHSLFYMFLCFPVGESMQHFFGTYAEFGSMPLVKVFLSSCPSAFATTFSSVPFRRWNSSQYSFSASGYCPSHNRWTFSSLHTLWIHRWWNQTIRKWTPICSWYPS